MQTLLTITTGIMVFILLGAGIIALFKNKSRQIEKICKILGINYNEHLTVQTLDLRGKSVKEKYLKYFQSVTEIFVDINSTNTYTYQWMDRMKNLEKIYFDSVFLEHFPEKLPSKVHTLHFRMCDFKEDPDYMFYVKIYFPYLENLIVEECYGLDEFDWDKLQNLLPKLNIQKKERSTRLIKQVPVLA